MPIIDPLGVLKEPAEGMLRMLGADIELSDPFREFALGLVEGLGREELVTGMPGEFGERIINVRSRKHLSPQMMKDFADHICKGAKGDPDECSSKVTVYIIDWVDDRYGNTALNVLINDALGPGGNPEQHDFAEGLTATPHFSDRTPAVMISDESMVDQKEAYLKFGKKAITFDCSRCQAIAERVAAAHAPNSPKRQLECLYYIKMFDEHEIGTKGNDTATEWLESHDLKDKLYDAYMAELNVEGGE